MAYPACPDCYDGPLTTFLDAWVAPALPAPESVLLWHQCVVEWARATQGPLVVRRCAPFDKRGEIYRFDVTFTVADNEPALRVYLDAFHGEAIASFDARVREQDLPVAFVPRRSEPPWKTRGRSAREDAFVDAGWAHAHVLATDPAGVPPRSSEELRRRAACLLSPLNHFPWPSPRRHAITHGSLTAVRPFVGQWLRKRYAGTALEAPFEAFLGFAAPRPPALPDVPPPPVVFRARPRDTELAPLAAPREPTEVYIASDDAEASFPCRTDVGTYRELVAALDAWLEGTDEELLGNAPDLGSRPWLSFRVGSIRCHLRADSRREGVRAFVGRAKRGAVAVEVNRGQDFRVNRLLFDGRAFAALHAFTDEEQPFPALLGAV